MPNKHRKNKASTASHSLSLSAYIYIYTHNHYYIYIYNNSSNYIHTLMFERVVHPCPWFILSIPTTHHPKGVQRTRWWTISLVINIANFCTFMGTPSLTPLQVKHREEAGEESMWRPRERLSIVGGGNSTQVRWENLKRISGGSLEGLDWRSAIAKPRVSLLLLETNKDLFFNQLQGSSHNVGGFSNFQAPNAPKTHWLWSRPGGRASEFSRNLYSSRNGRGQHTVHKTEEMSQQMRCSAGCQTNC